MDTWGVCASSSTCASSAGTARTRTLRMQQRGASGRSCSQRRADCGVVPAKKGAALVVNPTHQWVPQSRRRTRCVKSANAVQYPIWESTMDLPHPKHN